jgi:cAMP-dependent protein kinase regulator
MREGMESSQIRKLRDRAEKARLKGQSHKALEIYKKLSALDPNTARWPHQSGEILRLKGNKVEAVEMFLRAARLYLQGGFGVQAVALSKIVLDMDPGNDAAREILGNLTQSRQSRVSRWAREDIGSPDEEGGKGEASTPGRKQEASRAGGHARPPSVEVPSAEDFDLGSLELETEGATGSSAGPPPIPGSKGRSKISTRAKPAPPPIPPGLEPKAGAPGKQGRGAASPARSDSPAQPRRRERARPPSAEIELGSRETLDGLILRNVVGGVEEEEEEERAQPGRTASNRPSSDSFSIPLEIEDLDEQGAEEGDSERGDGAGAKENGRPEGRPGAARASSGRSRPASPPPSPPPVPDAVQRVEDAQSEVSIVRAVSAFEVPIQVDEVDDMLESVFPDEEGGQLGGGHTRSQGPGGKPQGDRYPQRRQTSQPLGLEQAAAMLSSDAVARTPLFGELPSSALERLVARMKLRHRAPETVIVEEGSPGGELYVVVEGKLDVVKDGVKVGELEPGNFFGEIAIVTDLPRQATVVAATEVDLLEISRELVVELIQEFPEVVSVLLRFFRRRMIGILMNTSPLFAPLDNTLRRELASRFKFLEVDPGVRFIKQSRPIPGMFVLLCGEAEIRVLSEGKTTRLARLGAGDVVGETSLLSARSSAHSAVSVTKCWMLFMPAKDLREAAVLIPDVVAYLRDLSARRIRAVEEHTGESGAFPVERLPVY